MFDTMLGAVAAALRVTRRDQRGQGTVEYVGVILLVGLLLGAVGGAITGEADTLAKTIAAKVETAIKDVTGEAAPPDKKKDDR